MGRRARQRLRSSQSPTAPPAAPRPSGTGLRFERRPDPERPRPAWHPLPVSEILIACGVVGVVVGMARGAGEGTVPLRVGLLLCGIAVFELTAREHFTGYRSHALLIAFLPAVASETLVSWISGSPTAARIALLPNAALFFALFRFLRGHYHMARARRLASLGG